MRVGCLVFPGILVYVGACYPWKKKEAIHSIKCNAIIFMYSGNVDTNDIFQKAIPDEIFANLSFQPFHVCWRFKIVHM